MPNSSRLRTLRTLVIMNLCLMVLLLLFGLTFDTKGIVRATTSNVTAGQLVSALNQAGIASYLHMGIGIVLGIFSLVNMVLSLRSGIRRVQVFGTLAFLSILAAGIVGLFFVASGFQKTGLLVGLVPLFMLAFLAYVLEWFFLRSPVVTRSD